MQVSHRFVGGRGKRSGRTKNNTISDFHISLLEVLPHAAAYIAQDGSILALNRHMKAACDTAGVTEIPRGLGELLSAAGWKRCETVLTAALSGVPAEVRGRIAFRSGASFCRHVMCTSLPLAGDLQAVLVQFDMAETAPATGAGSSARSGRRAKLKKPALQAGLLEHFPDDILVFDGSESADEKAVMLLELIGSDHEAGFLIEAIAGLEGDAPQTLYLPEGSGLETAGYAAVRQMCEIRLVPLPDVQEAGNGGRPAMAIIRHNVDCPHEVAENRRLAYLDPLTGLENRRAFTKVLERELKRLAADTETGLAVFYIDLDEFKKVNDLGGHDAGDDMLLRVAACLRLTLGEFGTAARIGGDEFAGMLPAANKEAALDVAESILDGFDRIRLEVGERVFTIGGSVGIAFVDGAMPLNQLDASVLLGLADRACLRGKRFGGQSVQLHAVQTNDCGVGGGEVAALPEPGSFRGNELTLYTMPIMCLKKNRICGSEVLLRLQGDRSHELSSRAWISAAERSGFIAQVDAWTLDKVLDAADRNTSRVTLTMNVSAESARDPIFRDGLSQRLSVNPLLAAKLCLEIAEKDFLREPATVESFFKFVSGLGCQTAIDDFAGHWPVLSRLTGLRVEWLKLDPGLTQQVADEPAKAAILNGLVRAAHELGIKVVAKHVETAEEADLLRELNIEAAQGFHFGRPEPWPYAGTRFG